jgi:serine/threonine protein kinase
MRTLQNSLFGQVQLAFDTHKGVEVAVKVSHAELVTPKPQTATTTTSGASSSSSASSGAASSTAAPVVDAAATARSQAGVSVLEDVRREARILRLLLGADQPPMSVCAIDNASCGLSSSLLHAIHLPANAIVQPGATNPLTIKQQFLDSIAKGKKSIAAFYDEVEAESFHYLISEFVSGGDLFSVLTAQPQHKVSEGVARLWFCTFTPA